MSDIEGSSSAAPIQGKKRNQKKEENVPLEGFTVDKMSDFPSWYEQIVIKADIMDKRYPLKGMPVFTAYGYFMHNEIMKILELEWDKLEINKVQFPVLIPTEFLEREQEHIRGFSKEVFWVTKGGEKDLDNPAALRPTSETAMYSLFSLWVRSFRDLPVKIHQTCCVYRYETKDTLPLIRAREIHWNEGHTCHATGEEALQMLEDAWASYLYLLNEKLCVFGLRLRRPIWDRFAGAEHTDVMDSILPSGKVLQIVGAHYLGQKFAVPFDIKFLNQSNEFEHGYMTCFGVSTRMLAACISVLGDNKGLVLPSCIAKYQVVITPIRGGKNAGLVEQAFNVAKLLQAELKDAGIRVFLDDSDKKPGEKYYFWEMKGVPLRVEVGPKDVEKGVICIARRDTGSKEFVPRETSVAYISDLLVTYDNSLRDVARNFHSERVTTCRTQEEMVNAIANIGGFARVPYWTDGEEGHDGDKIVHELTGGEIRGFLPSETFDEECECIITGKPAKVWAYVAKSY